MRLGHNYQSQSLSYSIVIIVDDQTPPEGYTKVDVDLNRGTIRGASIYLYYKVMENASAEDQAAAIQELAIEYGEAAATPYSWTKISVDLNSKGIGSSEGFGEPTFLFYRRAYSGLKFLQTCKNPQICLLVNKS
jgi:hypothetical protein